MTPIRVERLSPFPLKPGLQSHLQVVHNLWNGLWIEKIVPPKTDIGWIGGGGIQLSASNAHNFPCFCNSYKTRLGRPSTAEAQPKGKIHHFSKIAVTLEPVLRFSCPSRFRIS